MAKRQPFFTDPLVRTAFAYLFPIQDAMDQLSNGVAMRIVGPISPNKSGYHKGLVPYPYDPAKGKALLAQAGWADSNADGILDKSINGKRVDFKVSFMCPPTALFQAVSGLFVESLNLLGIGAELESPEDWRDRFMEDHDFDMFFISVSNAPGPSYPFSLFRSEDFPGGNNFSGYSNPLIDSLTAEVSSTFDPADRDALLYQIQEVLHRDLPYLFVSTGRRGMAIHKRYKDVKTSGVLPIIMLNTLAPSPN
jgi:peptide/nickel transport system substrate-binding protein